MIMPNDDNPLGTIEGLPPSRGRGKDRAAVSEAPSDPLLLSPDEKTPLNPEQPQRSSSGIQIGLGVYIFLPWLMFTTVSLLFATAYHHYPLLVLCLVLAWIMLSVMFLALDKRKRMGGSWYWFLSSLCLFAIAMGCMLGIYNYRMHMFQYWSYEENSVYTNVLPTEPADGHADAGKIVFAPGSRVDTTRAIGFKTNSEVYCVAPIFGDDPNIDSVEYWAAGLDCCPARGDFDCDDSWKDTARSGLVILDSLANDRKLSNIDAPSVHFNFWRPPRVWYLEAIKQAEAAYDIKSADRPLLVRWVDDPQKMQDEFWRSGVGFCIASVCIYFLFSIIIGAMLQMCSKRFASAANCQTAATGAAAGESTVGGSNRSSARA